MEKNENRHGSLCSDMTLGHEDSKVGSCNKAEKDVPMENYESSDRVVSAEERYLKGPNQEENDVESELCEGEMGLIRTEFGHHEKGMSRINNGSFGSCPASVSASQAKWAGLFLQQPDRFYFGPLQDGILQSRTIVAQLINAEHVEEVSLVDNATTAVAVVLQQVAWAFMEGRFQQGDAVIMLHYAYGAVKKAIKAYAGRAGAHIIEAKLPFPAVSNEEIISKFKAAVDEGKQKGRKIRLAVIDHITSMPTVLVPVKDLVRICREEEVDQVLVDGAHAIGNVDIDMQDIGADFYTSNLHKWFFCPPSVAFLYCRRSFDLKLHHPIVSHEFGNGLPTESAWVGTRDYSAQLCVPSALEFAKKFKGGIEAIRRRNHEKVVAMAQMLAEAWGTKLGTPPELASSMVMVALPNCLDVLSEKDALDLRFRLRKEFAVEVPIYYRSLKTDMQSNGESSFRAYARISHQIYNTLDDYLKFRDAIVKLVAEAAKVKEDACS